jgi:cellulose synthase/poly-beta-1,6-N-acetylglucosamine synthase-like glycosyltransferase
VAPPAAERFTHVLVLDRSPQAAGALTLPALRRHECEEAHAEDAAAAVALPLGDREGLAGAHLRLVDGGALRPRRNDDNVGFSRAANQGLAATAGPLVLIINPDCRLQPGAIDRLLSELERQPRCAIAGPRVLDSDGTVQGSARGDPTMLTGLFGRATRLTRIFPGAALARRNVRT